MHTSAPPFGTMISLTGETAYLILLFELSAKHISWHRVFRDCNGPTLKPRSQTDVGGKSNDVTY